MKSLASAVLALLVVAAPLASASAEESGKQSATSPDALVSLWQEWRGSGVWRGDYFHSSKTLDDASGFLGTTAQLKLLPSLSDSVDAKIEWRATNPAVGEGADTRTRLLEAYATLRLARADLHIGKQIVAWGRADGINPTDNLSPRDFTVLLPFEDDQRFGTAAVKLDWYLSQELTLTILGLPSFEPAEIPLPAASSFAKIEPPRTLSNTQAAVKLNRVGESADWSISYFRGFSLLPTLRAGQGRTSLELHYDRINAFGADFARNFGRFGVRGEVAYIDTADDSGRDPAVRNASLFWVVGVDRTFYEYLNVNLQFFERRGRNYRDPLTIDDPALRGVARLNAIVEGLPERVSHGISFRVSNQWLNETLEAEIFAAINLTRRNSFVRPLLTYAFTDRWKGTIGAELYTGAGDTQYGSQKANRGAFVELRYGF